MDGVFVALIVSAVLYAMALFADLTATRLMNLHYNAWVRSTELSRNVEEYWHSWNPGIEIMTQSNGGAQFVGLVGAAVANNGEDFSATVQFSYFKAPGIVSVSPPRGGVDGGIEGGADGIG